MKILLSLPLVAAALALCTPVYAGESPRSQLEYDAGYCAYFSRSNAELSSKLSATLSYYKALHGVDTYSIDYKHGKYDAAMSKKSKKRDQKACLKTLSASIEAHEMGAAK